MKVYISKYALTSGIKEIEGRIDEDKNMAVSEDFYGCYYHGEGKEWHRTFEEAQIRAEEMRLKKIESLKKQLGKYENMRF